jgi:UDP-N-acetylglucosamine--dolichyl-phosphate N-acetylglucosaminephosphotransferase
MISAIFTFLIVLYATPWTIRFLKRIDMVDIDQNKIDKPEVPISGGLPIMISLFSGLMLFIFIRIFFPGKNDSLILNGDSLVLFFAAMTSILIITFLGFIDDLLRKSHYGFPGLRQWQKPLLTFIAAIPLIVINAGDTLIGLPFLGEVEMGLLFPLFFIPIGFVGATNMVNMLAGFNGMETGMGIVYMGSLGLFAYVNESYVAALIALLTFTSLIGFYFYNKYPAKILPGDSLTYLLGGTLAVVAIIGNIERAALIISIPFFIEFFLKSKSRFKAQSFGYYKDGKIKSIYNKIHSIPHILTITGKYTEKQVVYFMISIELVFASLIWVI